MRLIQYRAGHGPCVARVRDPDTVEPLDIEGGTYALARQALAQDVSLAELASRLASGEFLPYGRLVEQRLLLAPLTHPDPAHCLVSGTGLTHLGSADTRAAMHRSDRSGEDATDSMRMFRLGVEGGKPAPGQVGALPEWFYKGDGAIVVAPEHDLPVPDYALDAGEEPELVGLYLIDGGGVPRRLGFALGNEFSDHVLERQNYLWLAHSKLRPCSFGPELLTGALPDSLEGTSRIRRNGQVLWERPFLTGEANMSHSLANLEHHHFKYASHRRPGDVHVHFFGTATLSFADGIRLEPGDRCEIAIPQFGRPLSNGVGRRSGAETPVGIRPL